MPRVATSARFENALKSGVKGEEEGNKAKKRTARATKSVDIIVWKRVNNSKDGVLVDMLFVSVRGDRASILDNGKCSTLIAFLHRFPTLLLHAFVIVDNYSDVSLCNGEHVRSVAVSTNRYTFLSERDSLQLGKLTVHVHVYVLFIVILSFSRSFRCFEKRYVVG